MNSSCRRSADTGYPGDQILITSDEFRPGIIPVHIRNAVPSHLLPDFGISEKILNAALKLIIA